jgi:hypothetical protein
MKLHECDNSLKTLVLLDIPSVAVKTVVKYCGHDCLARTLGENRARGLQVRYAEREVLSGLQDS